VKKAPTARDVRIGVVLTAVLLFVPVVLTANTGLLRGVDFAVPYTGGMILRQGNAAKLYDLSEQQRVQEEFLKRPGLLIDPFPPFHAPMFSPLTRLGYRNAYLTWGVINILLWLLFYYLIRNKVGERMNAFRFLKLSGLFFPLWIAIFQGQFSVLLLVAFALAFLYLKRGRDYVAGLALGLGLLKFQGVLPFALIFLLRRKWRIIAGLAGAASLLGLVSVIAVGPQGVVSYVNLMIDFMKDPSNPVYAVKPWNMPTIRGFVTGLLSGWIPKGWISALWMGLSGLLILITAWCWESDERRGAGDSFDLMFATALVVSAVAAPHLLAHDLTPVILAVVLVIASPEWRAKSSERLVIMVAIGILYASPLYLAQLVVRQKVFVLTPVLVTFALTVLSLGRRRVLQVPEEETAQRSFKTLAPTNSGASS
jgi:Glycosyltransferase family 87